MKGTAAVALLVLLFQGACSTEPTASAAPDYWLFSWGMRDGSYRFIVIPETQRAAFVEGFRPSFPGYGGISEAGQQLLRLPKDVLIGWGDATCSGLTYPPRDVMRPLQRFAADHGIRLTILPGRCQ